MDATVIFGSTGKVRGVGPFMVSPFWFWGAYSLCNIDGGEKDRKGRTQKKGKESGRRLAAFARASGASVYKGLKRIEHSCRGKKLVRKKRSEY